MAIQYYMRAFNTTLSQYVDWIVNDVPDSIGTFSGYPTNQLSGITVNKVVQSKIENFLKPNQGLAGTDGYYLHVNSYDWKNVTAPISPPNQLTGIAVERGITSVATINSATNATPIRISTVAAHNLLSNQYVTIAGVLGNIAANGTFQITLVNGTTFDLQNSVGSGSYISGGIVYTPTNFSTLTWDENNNTWRFVVNTNGDGSTQGSSQSLRINNSIVDGYEALGTNPASQGILRLPNNQFAFWRNQGNTTDIQGIGVDNLNRIKLGSISGDLVYTPGSHIVDGYIVHTNSSPALSGFIREQNNTNIISFRKQDNSGDVTALSSTGINNVVLGDAVNAGINYNTSTGSIHQFQVNSLSNFEIGGAFARFPTSIVAPLIYQTTALSSTSGQTLTIQAQNGGSGSTTGGIISLISGSGGSFAGTVDFNTGSTLKMRIHPTTAPISANNNSIQFFENKFRIDTAQASPRILQDDNASSSVTAQTLTLQSQNATGSTSIGGNLVLTSGTGTTIAGNVIIQTGGSNQIVVSPTQTTILGNLLVNGTTTSIASTVVEIADRVINLNSSANQFPGNTIAAPTQITGFAIDRGSTDNTTKRNYYGLFWGEADGYWRFAINTDGYTTQNVLTGTLPILASTFVAQPNGSVSVDSTKISTVGGFRALNNTTALASRNAASSQDLLLAGTDGSNHLLWGAGTQNAGTIFNTTAGTSYDFQVASASAYTILPISAGTTTLQAASTVTALVYKQADLSTNSGTGASTTIQAQNETGTTSVGGALNLTSGSGTTTNGALNLQIAGTTTASVLTNKFVYNKGQRRNITNITGAYTILDTDDCLIITTASSPFTINLPPSPNTGDTFVVKDSAATIATNNITISGNGNNIDGVSTYVMNANYQSVTLVYANAAWRVI